MPDLDQGVRLAAFNFLDQQTQLHGKTLPRDVLAAGFMFEGQRLPLLGPQGIFKPALLTLPLGITAVPPVEGQPHPCDDEMAVIQLERIQRDSAGFDNQTWRQENCPVTTSRHVLLRNLASKLGKVTQLRGRVMGFFTDRQHHAVRVLITDSDAQNSEFDLSRFQVGQTYELGPRAAEYLIGSRHAVVDRRQAARSVSLPRDRDPRG